jgi:hypothetical protein
MQREEEGLKISKKAENSRNVEEPKTRYRGQRKRRQVGGSV